MRYSPFFGMIATCLAALSRQSPEARKGRALARGVDGESACQAIMANAIMRHRRNAFIGCVRRQRYQTWRKRPCNPSTTRSARGCHPCLRYDPLPMSPGRAHMGETDCVAGVIGLELRCAERKFISLTSRPNLDLRDTAQTVAVSREDNLLCSPDCFLIAAHIAGGAPSGEPASHRSSNLVTQAGRIRTSMRREQIRQLQAAPRCNAGFDPGMISRRSNQPEDC